MRDQAHIKLLITLQQGDVQGQAAVRNELPRVLATDIKQVTRERIDREAKEASAWLAPSLGGAALLKNTSVIGELSICIVHKGLIGFILFWV